MYIYTCYQTVENKQMAITKCINCDKKIGLFNKPMFGYGKLKDGTQLCHPCFKIFNKYDISLATKMKNYDLNELKEMISVPKEKPTKKKPLEFDFSQNNIQLNKRENIALNKEIGKSETILKMFRCNFSEHIGILVFTEFQMILIVDGIFSMDAVRAYYYNQISRFKVEENSFKFKDSHNGYEGEMESFSKFNRTEFQNCVELLKEQIKVHKKYDKDSFPYLIQSYTSRKIGKEEFMNELKDWK